MLGCPSGRVWVLQKSSGRFEMHFPRGVSSKSAQQLREIGITFPKQPGLLWEKALLGGGATLSCSRGIGMWIFQEKY